MFGDKIICHKCNDIKIWKKRVLLRLMYRLNS